jgi:hypothetical protein
MGVSPWNACIEITMVTWNIRNWGCLRVGYIMRAEVQSEKRKWTVLPLLLHEDPATRCHLQTRKRTFSRHWICWCFILDFPAYRAVRNTFPLFLSYPDKRIRHNPSKPMQSLNSRHSGISCLPEFADTPKSHSCLQFPEHYHAPASVVGVNCIRMAESGPSSQGNCTCPKVQLCSSWALVVCILGKWYSIWGKKWDFSFKDLAPSWVWPVIIATWEVETGRSVVWGQPGQNFFETPSQPIKS